MCSLFLSLSLCVCLYFSLLYLTAFVPSVFLFLLDSLSLSLSLSVFPSLLSPSLKPKTLNTKPASPSAPEQARAVGLCTQLRTARI